MHITSCWQLSYETWNYTPPQNEVVERKNRHLLEDTCTILFQRNVYKYFWRKAVLTSVLFINRMPSRILQDRTLVSILSRHWDQYFLTPHIFHCLYFVHNYGLDVKKFDHKSIRVAFLGYSLTKKKYKWLHPKTIK